MIQENISLKPYNSFGIQVIAQYFSEFNATDFLQSLLETIKKKSEFPTNSILVLGGGSNILFTKNFEGFVLKNNLKGIELVAEDDEFYFVKAYAGENWHQFVLHCLQNNWAGVENLSLIPGNVGASPMQNIGAYGVELKDVFYALEALNIDENKIYSFSKSDCEFGYRESVFKNKFKNQFIILSVTFKLRKKGELNISYGAIEHELQNLQIKNATIKDVSKAVINIRNSKLPNPSNMGNAGSFFKNPSITKQQFLNLKNKFPFISGYENTDGTFKIPAGWLIEQCGWKGYRKNNVGCYEKQALVLVNYGNASGLEIFKLSEEIINSVKKKFNIILTREVNIY
jgi:UDP-N-acetylmuramate dehydrogenase